MMPGNLATNQMRACTFWKALTFLCKSHQKLCLVQSMTFVPAGDAYVRLLLFLQTLVISQRVLQIYYRGIPPFRDIFGSQMLSLCPSLSYWTYCLAQGSATRGSRATRGSFIPLRWLPVASVHPRLLIQSKLFPCTFSPSSVLK